VFITKDLVHKAEYLKYGQSRNVEANGDVYFGLAIYRSTE